MKIIVLVSMLIAYGSVLAADTPSSAQELNKSRIESCTATGIRRGNSREESTRFCTCVWSVFSENLTAGEFAQLESPDATDGNPSALPFWSRIEPKLRQCAPSKPKAVEP